MIFEPGQEVRSSGRKRTGYVLESSDDLTKVLFTGEPAPELIATDALELVVEDDTEVLTPGDFLNRITAYKLTSQLSDVLYGYLASRTQFRPYQFLPVLRFLESPVRRLLVADEVGLGKTIEAGLIWLELLARRQADRVLVICPSQLKEKWRRELITRFDIDATVINAGKEIDQIIHETLETPELADRSLNLIISVDTLRGECRLMRTSINRGEALVLTGLIWDLVIFDEAHHARNPNTARHKAVEALTAAADAQVFLTATPLNLGREDLYSLLRLLAPDRFQSFEAFQDALEPAKHMTKAVRAIREGELAEVSSRLELIAGGYVGKRLSATSSFKRASSLVQKSEEAPSQRDLALLERAIKELHPLSGVFTRTRKRDLSEPFATRTVRRIDVDWTPEEQELYDSLISAARSGGRGNPFAIVMPARQTASCLPVMVERIQQENLDYDPEEGLEDGRSYGPGWFSRASHEKRRWVHQAIEDLGDIDTKYEAFISNLKTLFSGEVGQALVFSFFVGTVRYLRRRLTDDGFSVEAIHGQVSLDERYRIMDRFREGEFQILLSTEVGAEGLDFEFCPCLVNYDLPWNPMRVEQRIGRLDRFGQLHDRIVIMNFHIPGTIETDIFQRLYERIGVFQDSIGDLDDILGDEMEEKAFQLIANLQLTQEEMAKRVDELAHTFELRRTQVEDLESHRELLAASEALLDDEFERIQSTGRLLQPAEIERLLKGYLAVHYPKTRWEARKDGSQILTLDQRIADSGPLQAALTERSLHRLRDLAYTGSPIVCTFNNERASRDHKLEFFTSRHPLVMAVAKEVAIGQLPLRLHARVNTDTLPSGRYQVAIYESVVNAVDVRKSLFCIAVDEKDGQREPVVEERLLGLLPDLVEAMKATSQSFGSADALRRIASEERRHREENTLVEADLLYERRLRATQATHEPKIRSARKRLETTRGTRIEAANTAQLRNLEQRYQNAIDELEEARQPEVTLRDIALMSLEVNPKREGGFVEQEKERQAEKQRRRQTSAHPPTPSTLRIDPSTILAKPATPQPGDDESVLCSGCNRSNTTSQQEVELPVDCDRCGQTIKRTCSVCERYITSKGCRAEARRASLSGLKFETADVRQEAKKRHFTLQEVREVIRRGDVTEEVHHSPGMTRTLEVHRLGTTELTLHNGKIVNVRRLIRGE